jgi:hypothetical protein
MSKKSKAHKRGPSRNKRGPVSQSRGGHRSRRNQRTRRSRGGADALDGAPVSYHLAGSWPSRMSLGQGADYFKYHVGQHGGYKKRHRGGMGYDSNMGGAPLKAITDSSLPQGLRMAAHIDGIDKAIAYSRQFKDPGQMGGRRRSKRRGSKRRGSKRRGSKRRGSKRRGMRRGSMRKKCWGPSRRRSNRSTRRRRGGSMGYAPFPNKGMLLDTPREYAQAGLNPQWKTDVAFDLAKVRSTQ